MVKTQLHVKIFLLKTNLNTILETSLSLFQKNVLAQYVSKLFHTVVQHIGIAFLSTEEIRSKVFDLLLLTFIHIS